MKSVKKAMRLAAIPAMIVLGLASSVNAQTITIESDEGQRSTTVAIDLDFTPGATAVAGYNTVFSYDPAILSGDPTVEAGAGSCTVDAGTSTISVIRATFPAVVIGAAERICTVNFPIGAAAAFGDYPLAHDPDPVQTGFSDTNANAVDGTVVDGQITISDAPPDVVLAFNPAVNVVFPGGVSGTTTDAVINVTVGSGTIGTGTIDNCVLSGPNAGAFAVVTGAATAPPADTLELEVTLANTALAATLTCDLDDASAPTTKVFQLSAPAGTPVPAPEYSSSPAPGSTINCNGPAGSQQFVQLTITNSTDFPGVGSNLDYTCAVAGAGFTLESAGSDSVEAGSSSIETFGCTVPAEGEPAAEGTVTCTSNDAANSPAVYDLSSIAATAPLPVPQPNVVPASSLWSQLSLIGLMAALGLLVVGLRRKG